MTKKSSHRQLRLQQKRLLKIHSVKHPEPSPKATRNIAELLDFISSRKNVPYAWGRHKNDCVAFVLGAAKAQTGHDRATRLRWETEKKALRLIKKVGGLEKVFDKYFKRIPPAQAMRGDIAGVADETFGIHPMIVEGERLVGPGEKGNRHLPRKAMIMAWSIDE